MNTTTPKPALLPAYLVVGEDELHRERVIERLHQRLAKLGDLDFNHERFRGEAATGQEIVNACNTLPFASEVRLVEVFDVDKLRKADSELLVEYLASPNATTILCLVAAKLSSGTRLYKAVAAIGEHAVIDCAPMKRIKLTGAVRSMATGHGIVLTQGAAATLIDLVGENTVALNGELKKLALAHRGSDPVNESEVISLVSRTAEVKPWEFVDAFSARSLERCLSLRPKMSSIKDLRLLALCTTRIRELLTAKALDERGSAGQLGAVLKVPDWRVKNHVSWSRGFTSQELIDALRSSRDAEQAMKSGTDQESAFTDWLLGVVVR